MGKPDITFCVALKNRSRFKVEGVGFLTLFPNCVASLAAACESAGVAAEIVVADFGSDDSAEAKDALGCSGIPYHWLPLEGDFSRGRGLNRAAREAGSDLLFMLDADMLIGPRVVSRAAELAALGTAYFPWCTSYRDPGHETSWERQEGWGMVALRGADFWKHGPIPEWTSWGHEDIALRDSLNAAGIVVCREKGEDLFHQWHPNDFAWKNRYYGSSPNAAGGK